MDHDSDQEGLQALLQMFGSLAASVTHQLNEQHTIIQGNIEALSNSTGADKSKDRMLGNIRTSASENETLMRDMLDLLIVDQTSQRFRIGDVVDKSLRLCTSLMNRHQVKLEQACSREALYCLGFPRELCRVLLMILDYCIHSMHNRLDNSLSVSLLRDVEQRSARIIIGPGRSTSRLVRKTDAPAHVQQNTFAASFDPARWDICQELLAKAGGYMQIELAGTCPTCTICLPISRSESGRAKEQPTRQFTRSVRGNSNSCLMVVEDKEPIRELISNTLQEAGFTVISATNGSDALEALNTQSIDGLVADLHMPEMDGQVFLASLKERLGSLPPTVVCSGWLTRADIDSLQALGVMSFVDKPFRPRQLLKEVLSVLDRAGISQ